MPPRISVIKPRSGAAGDFAAAWFDDAAFQWKDERLDRSEALLASWSPPRLRLIRPKRGATPVLYNPNVLAVSRELAEQLASWPELELLPIDVEDVGRYFLLHALVAVEAPRGTELRRADTTGNIVQIVSFPPTFDPAAAFFRVRQPGYSIAGRAGLLHHWVFVTEAAERAVLAIAGEYLETRVLG